MPIRPVNNLCLRDREEVDTYTIGANKLSFFSFFSLESILPNEKKEQVNLPACYALVVIWIKGLFCFVCFTCMIPFAEC